MIVPCSPHEKKTVSEITKGDKALCPAPITKNIGTHKREKMKGTSPRYAATLRFIDSSIYSRTMNLGSFDEVRKALSIPIWKMISSGEWKM